MELLTVSATLANHRLTQPVSINNGSLYNKMDVSSMRFSRVIGFGKVSTPSLQYRNRYDMLKLCQVKRNDSEGTLSSESMILDEQTLKRELQIAIQEENYAQAAKLRDNLKHLNEDSKAAVLAANTRFYNSFRNGDLVTMQALWSNSDNVCVVHPGVSGISGYELVMGSWEYVWADYEFPLSIEVKDVQVQVRGDVGYVTCVERVRTTGKNWGSQFATNVFEKIDGQWFMCIHHASHVDL
ncbi:putative NTF2-like domain superfamily, SnoaL-like domain-containing protein [Helianthus debilis subsp. tardiflorus]